MVCQYIHCQQVLPDKTIPVCEWIDGEKLLYCSGKCFLKQRRVREGVDCIGPLVANGETRLPVLACELPDDFFWKRRLDAHLTAVARRMFNEPLA